MELQLLGGLQVVGAGRPVPLPRGRARSLLALLALHAGEVVATDRLVDELWGGQPPRTAVTALQGLVSTLRRRLEPDRGRRDTPSVLVTHAPGYVLAIDREQVDAHRFRRIVDDAIDAPAPQRASRLRTALDLWRGPALADFTYEPFAQRAISALEAMRVTALEARIDADLQLGRHAEVVAELEELVADHPLREDLRAHLMVALYRCGRQAEALGAYRAARRQLVEELGTEPGPRLRALEQAVLAHEPSLQAPEPVQVPGPDDGGPTPGDDSWLGAGRRTVTVVFVDLSGTAGARLDEPVDPEVARPVVDRGRTMVHEVVEQHGGSAEAVVGDLVVGMFGLPVAHEDDAARAVRAGWRVLGDLADLDAEARASRGVRLVRRVGIASGEVVVDDPTAGAAATSGTPVALASHLQQAAAAGEALLASSTRDLVEDVVVVEPVDDVGTTAAPVWRLVDVAAAGSASVGADTTHVGRDDELAALRAALDRAIHERRVVLATVAGEAGIGKTRLVRAFSASVAGQARVATGHCRAYGQGITYWPLRELLQDLVDGRGHDGLVGLVHDEPHGPSNAAQVAAATGLADEPVARPGDLFLAVRQLVEAAARDEPVVAVVEDAHWAQPTFLDLVEYLGRSVRAPVLLVCLARPELIEVRPRWTAEVPTATSVELHPLGTAESRQLVSDRLGGRLLPPESMGRILAMGQGNPLFLEQLLEAVREHQEVAVPPTVQALLTARLDRLGPGERDVVRCASVFGVDVPTAALRALVPPRARPYLDRHLRALELRALVRPAAGPVHGGPGFAFRHVLIQQAAHRSLTHAARAELHERVAWWLEAEAGTPLVEVEELVGHHLEEAVRHRRELGATGTTTDELAVRAGERLASAGLRAYGRFDVPGAENLLSRARGLLPADHPDRPAVLRRLTEAYPVMGRPDEAAACFDELLALVRRDGDDTATRRVQLEQVRFRLITGPDPVPMATVRHQVEESLAAFGRTGDAVGVSQAHYVLASVHLRSGRMADLGEVAWLGIERARRTGELRERLGAPWWVLFHLLEGPTPVPECIRACEEVMDVGGLDHLGVVAALGHFRAMVGEVEEGRRLVARAHDLLRERIRLPRPLAFIAQQRAGVELLGGDVGAAVDALRQGLDVALRITERDHAAQIAAHLSLLCGRQGDGDEAARLAVLASEQAPAEGVKAQAMARAAGARVRSDRGAPDDAGALAEQALATVPDDMLPLRARLDEVAAEVARAGGRHDLARRLLDHAAALHERKGDVVGAGRSGRGPASRPGPVR